MECIVCKMKTDVCDAQHSVCQCNSSQMYNNKGMSFQRRRKDVNHTVVQSQCIASLGSVLVFSKED